jgi:formylglycine-generating enzyme required for sulfatase activity
VPPTQTPSPTPFPNVITDTFGVPMILIPAGEFTMGHDNNQAVAAPAHKVYLDAFYIDKYEVTNERYRACADAGVCTKGGNVLLRREDLSQHPVMDVTWYNAQAYCEWRSDGNRLGSLPTEAQWEKAARGTDERLYPWGNEPVTCDRARYTKCGVMTSAVGQHPAGASFYGVEDMAGNVWEWMFDWYKNDYYQNSPYENPTGPEISTGWKSERGGAWFYQADLQTAVWRNQAPPTAHYLYVGFRCVVTP